MFTGIIEAVGHISRIDRKGGDWQLTVKTGKLDLGDVRLGDSIAVSGVCLTVTALLSDGFQADVSNETLACTAFRDLKAGSRVNLEKALTLAARLGGHLVSGHVDGVGEVINRSEDGRSIRLEIRAPNSLARYIAEKGSICVNGVSLTVNSVNGDCFGLNVIPHTAAETTVEEWRTGASLNLEVDLIARYLERLQMGAAATASKTDPITLDLLARTGFMR
ncbi:Riboflavin synthase, alpha subunit [gamma proteobacterium HdN1]|nr:Riboflavin synthase, alpha subunit [gamma proteobacterium HdN1]